MSNNKAIGLSAMLVLSFAAVATGVPGNIAENIGLNNQVTTTAGHHSQLTDNVDTGYNIRVYLNGEQVSDTHNVLMDGEEAIKHAIGEGYNGNSYTYDEITVGNGTIPGDADSNLDSEWSSCGLAPATANYDDSPGDGQWNYTVTYDVTCDDVIVNTTAIRSPNAPSDIDYFAGAYLNRDINPYAGDTLTIEWSNTADDS